MNSNLWEYTIPYGIVATIAILLVGKDCCPGNVLVALGIVTLSFLIAFFLARINCSK